MENKQMEDMIEKLKRMNVSKDSAIAIAIMVKPQDKLSQMIKYLNQNPKITEEEILKQAMEIAQQ